MVTFLPTVQTGLNKWLISWTSDQVISSANPYRVCLDGVLVSTQLAASFELSVPAGGVVPIVEVLDVAALPISPAFPGYLILGWNLDSDAAQYRVEENVASVWTSRGTFPADPTSPWQSYSTALLADETTANWRVVPIDAAGNDGTLVTFTALMVRYPDVPAPTYAYNGSGPKTVTLS